MTERWLAIPGFEGLYEVSDLGRVRSLGRTVYSLTKTGAPLPRFQSERMLSQQIARHGYVLIHLYRGGKRTCRSLHSLVAEAFLGPPRDREEVCHRNGVRPDCRLTNLRYGTKQSNFADKVEHGTQIRGEAHYGAKLTEDAVRSLRAREITTHQMATEYGITERHARKIAAGEMWRHV